MRACLHARGPTVCVFARHASVSAVRKHEHNVLQYVWAEAGTIADCLVCFLFFFPPPSLFHVHVLTTIRFSS